MRQTFELAQVLLVTAFRLARRRRGRGPVAVGRRLVRVEPQTVLVIRHVSPDGGGTAAGGSCSSNANAAAVLLRGGPLMRGTEGQNNNNKKHKIQQLLLSAYIFYYFVRTRFDARHNRGRPGFRCRR